MINLRLPAAKKIARQHYPTWQQAWAYARYELLYLSWAVMEVALLTPVALALLPWLRYWPAAQTLLLLLLLLLLPFNLVRLLDQLAVSLERQRLVLMVGVVWVILLMLRLLYGATWLLDMGWLTAVYHTLTQNNNDLWLRDFLIIALVGFTWWRGIVLVTSEPGIALLGVLFRRGALIIAPLSIWLATRLTWSIAPYLLLFVLAGLTAVSLTRVEQAERFHAALLPSATPRWLSTVVGSSVLVTGLAALLATGIASLSTAQINWLWLPFRFGWRVLSLTVVFLLFPLTRPVERLLQWLSSLFAMLAAWMLQNAQPPPESDFTAGQNQDLIERLTQNPGAALVNWRLVFVILLLLLIVGAALLMGWRYRRNRLGLENGRFSRTTRQQTTALETPSLFERLFGQRRSWRDAQTIRSIRRAYQQLCAAAAAAGHPRDDSETPYEYLPRLGELWPHNQPDLRLITEAYVKIRYGTLPETRTELEKILAAWQRVAETEPVK
ncbi:MAG: DUF4129 domain-containing protein [Ardenticatenaceae bacterium]|nr:DUF4129 domain-containing protein [Ardenticatenaceae bacterium]